MTSYTIIQEKIAQGIDLLREFNIDCWITFVRESQLNGDPILPFLVPADLTWHSAIILTARGDTAAIVGKYDRTMVESVGAYGEVIDYVEGIRKPFEEVMARFNPGTIAVNYSVDSEICDGLTHGMYLTLVELLSHLGMEHRLVPAEPIISALRQRKSQTELALMQCAIQNTEEIFGLVAGFIRPGMTENQVAEFMRNEVKRRGLGFGWDPAACPAVFTGPDTAEAHSSPTARVIQPGHVLNMDFGVKYEGYCSDMQRTFYVLRPGETEAPPEVAHGFATIVTAIESARKAMKPGVNGLAIDAVARGTVKSAGYSEFPHALGHQVGRFSHDGTALLGPPWEKYGKKPFLELEKNMVFTLEPRLTIPHYGIATIEEMVVVTDKGADFMSTPQTKLLYVPSQS